MYYDRHKLLTLPDTPLQLLEDVGQQHLTERLVEVCEDVADGVQRVVTSGRHPLRFLHTHKHTVDGQTQSHVIYTGVRVTGRGGAGFDL